MRGKNAQASQHQIGNIVARSESLLDHVTILKGIVPYVHFLGPKYQSEADVVFAANQVQCVRQRVNVGAALVRRVSAVPNRKIARHLKRGEPAADAIVRRLIQARRIAGNAIALAAQVRARNVQLRRLAGSRSERKNVVENPAVADSGLVNCVGRKNVRLGHHGIAPMVVDVLVAAESVRFRPTRRSSGNEVGCLIVAEPAKG